MPYTTTFMRVRGRIEIVRERARTTPTPHMLSVGRHTRTWASPSRREGHDAHTLRRLACAWRGAAAARDRTRMRPTRTGSQTASRPFRPHAAAKTAGLAAPASAAFLSCSAGALHTRSRMGKPVHVSCWAGISAHGWNRWQGKARKGERKANEGRSAGAPERRSRRPPPVDEDVEKDPSRERRSARRWPLLAHQESVPDPGGPPVSEIASGGFKTHDFIFAWYLGVY